MREKTVITREQHDAAKEKDAARRLLVEVLDKFDAAESDEDLLVFIGDDWGPRARLLIEQWGTYKRRTQ